MSPNFLPSVFIPNPIQQQEKQHENESIAAHNWTWAKKLSNQNFIHQTIPPNKKCFLLDLSVLFQLDHGGCWNHSLWVGLVTDIKNKCITSLYGTWAMFHALGMSKYLEIEPQQMSRRCIKFVRFSIFYSRPPWQLQRRHWRPQQPPHHLPIFAAEVPPFNCIARSLRAVPSSRIENVAGSPHQAGYHPSWSSLLHF